MMKTYRKACRGASGLAAAIVLAACGGGGGSSSTAGIDGTGSPSPVAAAVVYGTITAFGSVYVNGVHFRTDSAEFEIEGHPGTQSDLAVGDVVLVVGRLDDNSTTQGAATRVVFDDAVEGPVQSIDRVAGTLVVLGQLVRVTPDTSFDNAFAVPSLDGISQDDIVEVSGLRGSDGAISASRIEPRPPGLEFETTGLVAAVDSANMTFAINGLSVLYSSAMLNDFPVGGIANGQVVEIKGSTLNTAGQLVASRIEFKGASVTGNIGDRVEVEGFVTRFVDSGDFDVAGLRVVTNGQTVFDGGTAGDLGLDVKVEVEGRLDANGALVATKVDLRRTRAVRLAALVDAVASDGSSFVALNITIKGDALTRYEDKSAKDLRQFGIRDIVPGDYVEVRGLEFPAGSDEVLAGLVERIDADTRSELQGFVDSVPTEPSFTILGVTVTTAPATTSYRSADGASIASGQFFAALTEGSLVKAKGTYAGSGELIADEVEFQLE
jgi:hypothetical protein